LIRAALELGHPQDVTLGVNPQKHVSQTWIAVKALLYLSRRGIVKFCVRFLIKKVVPRAALRISDVATVWIEITVNMIFNFLAAKSCMTETALCCIGPSAITEVVHKALNERRQHVNSRLPVLTKLMALRAVGVSVVNKCVMHPNNRHLLQYLSSLMVDDKFVSEACGEKAALLAAITSKTTSLEPAQEPEKMARAKLLSKHLQQAHSVMQKFETAASKPIEKVLHLVKLSPAERQLERQAARLRMLYLDDVSSFMAFLPMLERHEADFVLSILVLAFAADASVGIDEWRFIEEVAELCDPPRQASWTALQQVVSMFSAGTPLLPADLKKVLLPYDSPYVAHVKDSARMVVERCCRCCREVLNFF